MDDKHTVASPQHDVFLVGAPRSGTTWVQAVLSTHPSFVSPAETNIFHLIVNAERGFRGGRQDGLGLSWAIRQDVFDRWCGQLWSELRSGLLANSATATRILEKTPDHILCLDLIRHLVPDARFVHLVRHPADVVRSTLEAASTWARSWAPSTVEGATAHWEQRVRAGLASARSHDTLLVRYEDLRSGPENWRGLLEFVGIEPTWALPDLTSRPTELLSPAMPAGIDATDRIQASTAFPGASFHDRPAELMRELTDFERRYVEQHTAELMAEFGYEPHADSATSFDTVRVFLRAARRRVRRAGGVILHGS